ncbi:hypothetical protein INT46_002940 [Mucor plumbeus]|uniref:Uncharacterized protein n=1 Tax=Mucor plumbeus TaxID=97098 RepID=A0A8H7VG11_9FUNG|nr:hypothetical protein INT46_002940 [Mucor plumbeus]
MSTNIPNTTSTGISLYSTASAPSFSNKSCYRLYAGHGNWINLNAKTTQDLLRIFEKGEPCRYQLASGLFIDIIPNDVDCNSKNIDMVGLMRADLVYEPQMMENHVQQLMSHYIRSLLDEQGIIDAFPPLRQGENLPIITSIPTHRHLSLVPSVVGTVRRGPKSSNTNQQRKGSSSLSLVTLTDDDHLAISSSSSTTHDSFSTTNANTNRKRAPKSTTAACTIIPRRSHLKRSRQNSNNTDSIELISPHTKRHILSLELPNLNSASINNSVFTNNTASINMSSFMDHSSQSNVNGGLLGFNQQQHNNHHQQQLQHHTSTNFWIPSYQSSPTPTSTRSSGFNFEFGMDFDHVLQQQQQQHHQQQPHQKLSPTDILHEYNTTNFSHHIMTNEHDLYSNNAAADAAAAAVTHIQQQNHVNHSHILNDNQQHMMTTGSSSDTTSLESFIPASPVPANWLESNHHLHHHQQHQQQKDDSNWHQHHFSSNNKNEDQHKTLLTTAPLESSESHGLKKLKFEFTENTTVETPVIATTTTAPPIINLVGDGNSDSDKNNSKDNVYFSHEDGISSPSFSPSTTSSQ